MNESEENIQLTSADRKKLRGIAMNLSPTIHIGKAGLTDTVLKELETAFKRDELVKIKFEIADREKRAEIVREVATKCSAELCGSVGKTASYYRENPELEHGIL